MIGAAKSFEGSEKRALFLQRFIPWEVTKEQIQKISEAVAILYSLVQAAESNGSKREQTAFPLEDGNVHPYLEQVKRLLAFVIGEREGLLYAA